MCNHMDNREIYCITLHMNSKEECLKYIKLTSKKIVNNKIGRLPKPR